MTRFFRALLHFGFACPQFITWKWLDFLVRCCTSFFASPQFVIWKWLDFLVRCCTSFFACAQFVFSKWLDFLVCWWTSVSLLYSLSFENDCIFWCVAALRFRFSTICRWKMTGFFGALLHFGFACPQFVIWKWLDILVRCCTSVSLVHSLLFQNNWIFWCVAALRFRFSTVCHLIMTGFFGALLHIG